MARSVEELLGTEAIRRIRLPVAEAGGLPRQAYTSQAFFDLEREKLFPRVWTAIGFTADVPEPGDAIPLMVAGLPLILCRDRAGEIRVFHNVCRHRAAQVLLKPAKGLRQFACPYHAWAWHLSGELKGIPYFDGTPGGKQCGLDWEKNGLVPVRTGVWHHWVFVNIDGRAPPLEEYLAPLIDLTQGFDLSGTRFHSRHDWEFKANWKFQNDNWETYHHTWVHEGVFEKMSDDLELETKEPWMATLSWGPVSTLQVRRGSNRPFRDPSALPAIPRIPDRQKWIGGTSIVFPNVTMTIIDTHVASVITDPIAPDRTHAILGFFFEGDAATDPKYEAARAPVLDRWLGTSRRPDVVDGIRSEDFAIWECQQVARASPVADDVKFSPVWERNIHHFHNHLIDVMSAP